MLKSEIRHTSTQSASKQKVARLKREVRGDSSCLKLEIREPVLEFQADDFLLVLRQTREQAEHVRG